jgi:predicted thioesterase
MKREPADASKYHQRVNTKIDIGRRYESQTRIEEWMTAEKAGNKGVDVLSTPILVQLIEQAAIACIAPMTAPEDLTLGAHIDVAHLRPTPVGLIVRVEVEVLAVNGPRIEFAFTAFDEREKIAEGTHERYIMARTKFLSHVEEKLT